MLKTLSDKIICKRSNKCVALSNLSIHYTCKNIKKSYENNKFKISPPSWNEEFELPDRSYFVSGIRYYFEYIFKKQGEIADNPSIRIYVNKMENRNTLKIKTEYYLELLTPQTRKFLGSSKSKITKDKNGEDVPNLEVSEVVLVHCNIVNNSYQKDSRVLYTFVPNKSFGQSEDISPKNFTFLETFTCELLYTKLWFTF